MKLLIASTPPARPQTQIQTPVSNVGDASLANSILPIARKQSKFVTAFPTNYSW